MSVRSRTVIARLGTAALLSAAALALTAPAHAQNSPFTPIPQAPPQQTVPAQTGAQSDPAADEGLSRTQQLLIGVAGFVLLVGIGLAIVRDARQAAPAGEHDSLETGESAKGSRRPKRKRVAQGRARAKRAKQARRKNR